MPLTPKQQRTVEIQTVDGAMHMECKIVNGFAIHRTPMSDGRLGKVYIDDAWSVTHVQSGHAVERGITYRKDAIDLCKRLNPDDVQVAWEAYRTGDYDTFRRVGKKIKDVIDVWDSE